MSGRLEISRLVASDRAGWEPLARGYKAFYKTQHTDAEYDATFARLVDGSVIWGLAARREGRILGIAHAYFHPTAWGSDALYLQDLYVDEAARGQGIAAALIEVLAAKARDAKASRFYWMTHHENARARALYDRVAQWRGFLRYEVALDAS